MNTSLARRSTQMKEFWYPAILQVRENITERRELVLQLIHKHFSTFLNADMPTLRATQFNHCIRKLTPLGL